MESIELIQFLASHPQPKQNRRKVIFDASAVLPTLTHTLNHENCPACDAADALIKLDPAEMAKIPFADVSPLWLARRKRDPNMKPRALDAVNDNLNALERFFHRLPLNKITAGMISQYQEARRTNVLFVGSEVLHPWQTPAGASAINHDCNCLGQILKFCGLWKNVCDEYHPLKVPSWSPKVEDVLTKAEEEKFIADLTKADDPLANLAFWSAILTINTSASGIELRGLRMQNVMLQPLEGTSSIYVPEDAVKNNSRPRRIVLNEIARWAASNLKMRAWNLGCRKETDFLYPFRENRGSWTPSKRASRSFLTKSWKRLQKITGHPELTPHMLRHLCITKLFASGCSRSMVKNIAGHITDKMADYYDHPRMDDQAVAVNSIETPNVIPFASAKKRKSA